MDWDSSTDTDKQMVTQVVNLGTENSRAAVWKWWRLSFLNIAQAGYSPYPALLSVFAKSRFGSGGNASWLVVLKGSCHPHNPRSNLKLVWGYEMEYISIHDSSIGIYYWIFHSDYTAQSQWTFEKHRSFLIYNSELPVTTHRCWVPMW